VRRQPLVHLRLHGRRARQRTVAGRVFRGGLARALAATAGARRAAARIRDALFRQQPGGLLQRAGRVAELGPGSDEGRFRRFLLAEPEQPTNQLGEHPGQRRRLILAERMAGRLAHDRPERAAATEPRRRRRRGPGRDLRFRASSPLYCFVSTHFSSTTSRRAPAKSSTAVITSRPVRSIVIAEHDVHQMRRRSHRRPRAPLA